MLRHDTPAACALLAILTGAPAARAAAAQDPAAGTGAYVALLERCARGDADGAARAILQLDFHQTRKLARRAVEEVESEMAALRRLGRGTLVDPPTRGFLNQLRRKRLRRLKLALLLHTEAALRTAAPRQQLLIARDVVGRLRELERDFARDGPLDAAPVTAASSTSSHPEAAAHEWPSVLALVRDWYLLVFSHLASLGDLELMRPHVASGLDLFRNDPELLLARGSMSESEADGLVVDRSVVLEIYTPDLVRAWRQRLIAARRDYQEAWERQPDLHEARLRWGRVNALLGDRSNARRALTEVAAAPAHDFLRYLAHLFLGDLAEQSRDPRAARLAYESALDRWPVAQAPKLSLSRLCVVTDDANCARTWLARAMNETGAGRGDPWWDYLHGQSWRGDERLESFRRRGMTP
jgi:hypothetical protein